MTREGEDWIPACDKEVPIWLRTEGEVKDLED
jgi:hypothetical protein